MPTPTWKKDPVHPTYYFGPYSVFKLNSRKRSMVSWLVERDGKPISNERQLRDAKAFVEANAKLDAELTPAARRTALGNAQTALQTALQHLHAALNTARTHDEQQRADAAAREWLASIGSEPD